jgi:hypothetical protein
LPMKRSSLKAGMTIATEGCWDMAYRPTSGVEPSSAADPFLAVAAASLGGESAPVHVFTELSSGGE